MRMRRKKYLDERLDACGNVNLGWLVDYAAEQRGETQQRTLDVREIFGNDNPVHLEVGCGKGGFAVEAARRNPDINFIAVEMARNVIVSAMELAVKENLPNLKFLMGKAEYLEKFFPENSVERIYLNFSCPYPKETYKKHRLTHPVFLEIVYLIFESRTCCSRLLHKLCALFPACRYNIVHALCELFTACLYCARAVDRSLVELITAVFLHSRYSLRIFIYIFLS